MTFFEELRRRNVLRVAVAYVVTAWLIIQVVETILPHYDLEHHVRTVITVLAIGFVPAMILAWALEWTPTGIRRDTGAAPASESDSVESHRAARRFDRIVIVILTVALAWFVYDKLAPAAPEAQYSIAVLPFTNDSPGELPDYLPEGLAGEVIDLLGKLPELLVIARSSAFSFKGQDLGLTEIGTRLGVTHLVTGALSQLGDRIRVRASLVDAGTGSALWSRDYAGTLADIFGIHDAIAADIAAGLEVNDVSAMPASRRTEPEAFALTLQARQLWYGELDRPKGDEMAALLDEALRIDPLYVPAMNWKIYANWERMNEGVITPEQEKSLWLRLAARILALEPDNAKVHDLFAWQALYMNHDIAAAAASTLRALSSAPNDAEVLRHAARFAHITGHTDAALALIDRAMAADPLCSFCLYDASKLYMWAGRLDEAKRLRRRFITLHDQGQYQYGLMLLLRGESEAALAVYSELETRFSERNPVQVACMAHAGLAITLHELGRHEESDAHLTALIEQCDEQHPVHIAQAHAWRNERDAAFEWIDKARDKQPGPMRVLMLFDPMYRNLHDDPRWTDLREQVGLFEDRLAAIQFSLPPELRRERQEIAAAE